MGFKYIIRVKASDDYHDWIESDWIKNGLTSMLRTNDRQLIDPWYQTELAYNHHQLLGCVAGEFYRRVFDSKSNLLRLKRSRGKGYQDTKKFVSLNAELWEKVWRMLERMESLGRLQPPQHTLLSPSPLPTHANTPLWFLALLIETELLTPWVDYLPPDGSIGFEALRKQQQNVNRQLMNLENPFENSYNRLFIQRSIAIAEKFDQFHKHIYNPMVRQRQAVTTFMVKHEFKAFDINGLQSRQGRRK